MKQNAVYIIPPYPLFERSKNISFEELADEDFTFLKVTLYLNLLENINIKKNKLDIYKIFNFTDTNLLLPDFIDDSQIIFSNDVNNLKSLFYKLSLKEFISYKNNLIIFSDVLNLRSVDIEMYLNLLNVNDNTLVIAKSSEGLIKVFGFNNYSEELFKQFSDSKLIMDKFLSYIKSCDYFVNTLNDVLIVNNKDEFKKSYLELSLKKSNDYCSQKMHERFTHLFVEYKDLLK